MKNFYSLSPIEAYRYFVRHEKDIIREEPASLPAVTICAPTHRMAPENKQDALNLKNLIVEVEKELCKRLDKKQVPLIVDNLKKAHDLIDYSRNLDSMLVFGNEKFVAVTTLAIDSQPGFTIGKHFDIRPLLKARQQTRRYYILAISKKEIRLIEALNDRLIKEIDNEDFPFINDEYYTTDKEKLAQDIFVDNLIKEFFNVSDKRFKKYLNANHLPVVLAGDVKMMAYYVEKMDDDRLLIGRKHGNYIQMPIHEIISQIYPVVQDFNRRRDADYMDQINNARSANRLVLDYDEINRLTMQGNVQSLFIGESFSLKGHTQANYLVLDKEEKDLPESRELSIEIIDHTLKNGGKVFFMEDELLDSCQGLALIRKY